MFSVLVHAQDTVKVMQYNLLYYGQTSSFCTTTNNNETAKDGYLRTIIKYAKPDIFTVNEIAISSTQHQHLLNNCLNVDGVSYYNKCNFSNQSSSDLSNELYFNSEKLGFSKQVNIATSVRDINIYKLYYKSWNLGNTHDTAFVTCIIMDLKAGSTASDIADRATETNTLINYLATLGVKDNYMVMGDFNVYSGTEQCYQNLLNPTNQNVKFNDPINQVGDWHGNYSYAAIHTQSTHTASSGCYVTGGLDDRFDHIMISDYIRDGAKHVLYFTGSYKTIGQDGHHFNDSLTYGVNNSAPDSVIQALFGMSDHLPVSLMLRIDQTVGVNNVAEPTFLNVVFENPVEADMAVTIELSVKEKLTVEVINILGQPVYSAMTTNESSVVNMILPTKFLDKGIYFLKITDSKNNCTVRKFVKE